MWGDAPGPPIRIRTYEPRAAGSKQLSRFGALRHICERYRPASDFAHASFDLHELVVSRTTCVLDFHVGDRQHHPLALDLRVRHSGGSKQLGAAELEPGKILHVVRAPHLIRLSVAHAK